MSSFTYIGCYSKSYGLKDQTTYIYQSLGWCLQQCVKANAASFALTGGSDCLCGGELPPYQTKVAQDRCNLACNGFPSDICGGDGFYSVYTTGLKEDVPTYHQSPTSLSADESQSRVGTSSDVSWTSNTPDNISKNHRATAIIVGSVVGVCALAVLIGTAFFWLRSKRHNFQYNSDNVVTRHGNSSHLLSPADSRVNSAYMTQCYHSNGSIDDYHDYSRRILHLTNPDN